jgi:dTMP kinase
MSHHCRDVTLAATKDNSGLFVTIDGPNGVGKSSLVSALVSRLHDVGVGVLETTEPTRSYLGQLVRKLETDYHGLVYACLIAADRYFHIASEIGPAVQSGQVVISTRYVESSLVLQRLDNVPLDFIWAINSQVLIPDISVILTAPPEVLERRLAERSVLSRFEETKGRVAELAYYLEAAQYISDHGFNVVLLDNGHTPLETNVTAVMKEITSHLCNRERQ